MFSPNDLAKNPTFRFVSNYLYVLLLIGKKISFQDFLTPNTILNSLVNIAT